VIARLGCIAVLAALAGCATTDRVVLLPDDNTGKVGKIDVLGRDGGEVLLDSAYGEAQAGGGKVRSEALDADKVRAEFGAELANLPPRPVYYTLYFEHDSDQLTAESQALLPEILDTTTKRAAPELVVIGHTDATGSDEHNDKLSLERAQAVRDLLVAHGFDPAHIVVAGRGARAPLVETAAGVAEPKNRRVEVEVR
jgi:outer membrane protein OmpA-like peptidoglycan-associated protein